MPIPVSVTENTATGSFPGPSAQVAVLAPVPVPSTLVAATWSFTRPRSVNLTALESRFPSTWRSRCRSVTSSVGADAATETSKSRPFSAVSGRNVAWMSSISAASVNRSARTSIRPASTFDRSRMSLMSCSRSEPAE